MDRVSFHRRLYRAFLSHAHSDKAIVDNLYAWLSDTAKIPNRTPYMLSNQKVLPYANDADLLGIIHQITFPYRRRILNSELA